MKKMPNLLLIMCDQLRADVLGCYGNTLVQTPNIDRIAQRGVCFDRAYSQTPVCVPARHGLISGQNPFGLGLLKNENLSKDIAHPLPELIRRQGYYTCHKYIYHANGAKENLFDLRNDPDEFCDIAAEYPDICGQCREEMVEYYRSCGLTESLAGNRLVSYEHERHIPRGYLDQFPRWPGTVVSVD